MAEKRAAFSLRRRRSLGFSKCRWLRTTLRVPSRSIFFFKRRRAFSTDSPFLSLISVKLYSLPLPGPGASLRGYGPQRVSRERVWSLVWLSTGKGEGETGRDDFHVVPFDIPFFALH